MFKKALTGIAAAATVAGSLVAMAPAQAAGLTTPMPKFEWKDLKNHEVKDRSTDTSGFQALIPQFQTYVQKERLAISAEKQKAQALDPTKLFMKFDHNVRVWFLNEGAGYKNQLGYQTVKDGQETSKGQIFNNISCDISGGKNSACQLGNNGDGVLDIGDYVDIGKVKAGTQLNFLLRSDGFNGGQTVLGGADPSQNIDKLQHMMAYQVGDYLLMGFEDIIGGGDLDFNDVVFVVDFGKGNLTNQAVPEPGTMAALLGVTGASMWMRRRKKQASA
ncbi:MAG: DUF4114 domain-containing protein [Calothrix sp. FI2-JRJ7]|jgi:hypothetical protein|nr:DUF4114 domain-containing protein [Calothrix sp. FI2-JRJ7]